MAGLSPKLPLTFDGTDGAYVLNKRIEELTIQNLKNLILTCPGERMMDPDFGVGLRNYLFQQNAQSTYDKIRSRIIEQTGIYMDYISIDDVIFNPNDNSKQQFDSPTVFMTIKFTILPLNLKDILMLPIYF